MQLNTADNSMALAHTLPQPAAAQAKVDADAGKNGDAFSETLARASAEAREAAEQFVATAFIMPMLSAMREDPFRSDLFHGGSGEDAFGQQLDTNLADRIVQRMSQPVANLEGRSGQSASQFDLVESIHRRVMDRVEGIHRAAEKLKGAAAPAPISGIDLRG